MTSPSIFDLGTVTLTNGSAEVVGSGTAWAVNGVAGGLFSSAGMSVPIASVDDDTTLTLAYPWPGANAAGVAYAISLLGSQAADTIWASRHWSRIVGQALLAGIHPAASGTLAERDALNPMLEDGQWFARAEPPHDLTFYRKVPEGWDGPYLTRGVAGVGEGGMGLPSPGAANMAPYYSAADTIGLFAQTAFGRALAGITGANGKFPVATGAGTVALRDIVGTVSQVSGIPTGAIIENGTNANGRYIKFADGTQICISPDFVADANIATGSIFRGNEAAWTLPAAFVDNTYAITGGTRGNAQTHWVNTKMQDASNGGYCLFAPASVTTRPLRLMAIGRWF